MHSCYNKTLATLGPMGKMGDSWMSTRLRESEQADDAARICTEIYLTASSGLVLQVHGLYLFGCEISPEMWLRRARLQCYTRTNCSHHCIGITIKLSWHGLRGVKKELSHSGNLFQTLCNIQIIQLNMLQITNQGQSQYSCMGTESPAAALAKLGAKCLMCGAGDHY